MKNFKKVFAVLVAVMVLVSAIGISPISASAAETTYVISAFNDQDNTGGNGVMDPLGQPMTTNPTGFGNPNEYCGNEWAEIIDDAGAEGGKALKIHMEPGYANFNKTTVSIRGISENNALTVKAAETAYTFVRFSIYFHNYNGIYMEQSAIELSQDQDKIEYQRMFRDIPGIQADKWIECSIPFSQFLASGITGDMKLNMFRIFLAGGNKDKSGDNPYVMIDNLRIVVDPSQAGSTPGPGTTNPGNPNGGNGGNGGTVSNIHIAGAGNGGSSSSKQVGPSSTITPSKKPASSLVDKKQQSSSSEETSSLDDDSVATVVNGIADGSIQNISEYTKEQQEQIKAAVAAQGLDVTFNSDGTLTLNKDEGLGWVIWVIIAAAVIILIGGGLAVYFLVFKSPKAPAAEAAEAPAEEAASEEAPSEETKSDNEQ